MKNGIRIIDMATRVIASAIFAYTAYMKFTAAPSAVYIFQRISMEPVGRYAVGGLEVLTIILLLIPRSAWRGALLGALMMFGAICMHLTIGEFSINGDGGLMFGAAIVVLACCVSILVMHKTELETELN